MINRDRLVSTFLELVQIDSPSGQEEDIARHLMAELKSLNLLVARDKTGNVIGRLAEEGATILLSAHMDTVGPGRGGEARYHQRDYHQRRHHHPGRR